MIRKLLLVAAAIVMPASAGTVALVGTAEPAGAVTTITCTVTAVGQVRTPRAVQGRLDDDGHYVQHDDQRRKTRRHLLRQHPLGYLAE